MYLQKQVVNQRKEEWVNGGEWNQGEKKEEEITTRLFFFSAFQQGSDSTSQELGHIISS